LTAEEVKEVAKQTGLTLIAVDGVNHKDDLFLATSVMSGCDGFLGVASAPTWQAAYSGVPTISLGFSEVPQKQPQSKPFVTCHNPIYGPVNGKGNLIQHLVNNYASISDWFRNNRVPVN
jgi:ADP-heptose:LPS heptosyltransferase